MGSKCDIDPQNASVKYNMRIRTESLCTMTENSSKGMYDPDMTFHDTAVTLNDLLTPFIHHSELNDLMNLI